MFKTKYKPNGDVERFKACLVAKGFQQDLSVNFGDTFSPIAKITTNRLILALATTLNWEIKQLDINNAFLNGELQEEVYTWQLRGFENPKYPHHVCKLHKAIYGLKKAPRAWFECLRGTLISWGFYNTKGDSSLFIHKPNFDNPHLCR